MKIRVVLWVVVACVIALSQIPVANADLPLRETPEALENLFRQAKPLAVDRVRNITAEDLTDYPSYIVEKVLKDAKKIADDLERSTLRFGPSVSGPCVYGGSDPGGDLLVFYANCVHRVVTLRTAMGNLIQAIAGRYGLYHTVDPILQQWRSPEESGWSRIAMDGAPSGRIEASVLAYEDGVIVWGGGEPVNGFDDYFYSVNTGSIYDPVSDRWKKMAVAGAPKARQGAAATVVGRKLYIHGGWFTEPFDHPDEPKTGEDLPLLDDLWEYDLDRHTWQLVAEHTGAFKRNHILKWSGTQFLIWGGSTKDRDDTPQGEGILFNPKTGVQWTMATDGAPSKYFPQVHWVKDGDSGEVAHRLLVYSDGVGLEHVGVFSYDTETNVWDRLDGRNVNRTERFFLYRGLYGTTWTGQEFLMWSGWPPSLDYPGLFGASLDIVSKKWTSLPYAPLAHGREMAGQQAKLVFDGNRSVYAMGGIAIQHCLEQMGYYLGDCHSMGVFDLENRTWRVIARPPVPFNTFEANAFWVKGRLVILGTRLWEVSEELNGAVVGTVFKEGE